MKTILLLFTLFISSSLTAGENDNEFKIKNEMFVCFNIKEIKINLEYDRIQWSPNESFTYVCSFSLHVSSNNVYFQYLTRRWRSPAYCKKFMKEWKELKKENKKVCIAAYISYPEKAKYKGKEVWEQSGFWEEIKSNNWCHTYFGGNCRGITRRTESF
jgi:hypothetical protein